MNNSSTYNFPCQFEDSTCTALDISRYLLLLCHMKGISINNLYLQKLLYYVQGYSYRIIKEEAFSDDFVKWQFGPTVLEVYFEYNIFRSSAIDIDVSIEIPPPTKLSRVINRVVNQCSTYSLRELVDMTTSSLPCLDASEDGVIYKCGIRQYFLNNDPLHLNMTGFKKQLTYIT